MQLLKIIIIFICNHNHLALLISEFGPLLFFIAIPEDAFLTDPVVPTLLGFRLTLKGIRTTQQLHLDINLIKNTRY